MLAGLLALTLPNDGFRPSRNSVGVILLAVSAIVLCMYGARAMQRSREVQRDTRIRAPRRIERRIPRVELAAHRSSFAAREVRSAAPAEMQGAAALLWLISALACLGIVFALGLSGRLARSEQLIGFSLLAVLFVIYALIRAQAARSMWRRRREYERLLEASQSDHFD